ncbi:MAG: ABC transporter substrate-binding protein [Pseudomonadales bacterium]|jgi:phospholipid transport system substrate-binding protein|nr:ABC transporter substrate-binding protein [Pseudomonadales bacterium]
MRHLASFYTLFFALLLSLGFTSAAQAQRDTPSAAVKTTVDAILAVLRKPDFTFARDRSAISATVTEAFDATAMAQSVLSTNWRSASKEQQDVFRDLLLQTIENTYIDRIKAYTNESVEFRGENTTGDRSTVQTVIVTAKGNVPVNYKLRQRSDGWFVYDVEVENVSMVSSYRDTYRDIVRRSGMNGLLEQMRVKLAQLKAAQGA